MSFVPGKGLDVTRGSVCQLVRWFCRLSGWSDLWSVQLCPSYRTKRRRKKTLVSAHLPFSIYKPTCSYSRQLSLGLRDGEKHTVGLAEDKKYLQNVTNHPDWPHVSEGCDWFIGQNLRCHEFRRSEHHTNFLTWCPEPGQAEIDNFDLEAIPVQAEYVFGLQRRIDCTEVSRKKMIAFILTLRSKWIIFCWWMNLTPSHTSVMNCTHFDSVNSKVSSMTRSKSSPPVILQEQRFQHHFKWDMQTYLIHS